MQKLQSLGTPVAAMQNCLAASKCNSSEANRLAAELYLARNAQVMLTSNLCAEVGFQNGARRKVVNLVYNTIEGRICFTEAVVVQFEMLNDDVAPFLADVPRSVEIAFWCILNRQLTTNLCLGKSIN